MVVVPIIRVGRVGVRRRVRVRNVGMRSVGVIIVRSIGVRWCVRVRRICVVVVVVVRRHHRIQMGIEVLDNVVVMR